MIPSNTNRIIFDGPPERPARGVNERFGTTPDRPLFVIFPDAAK